MEQVCWTLGCDWSYPGFLLEPSCGIVKDLNLNGFGSSSQEICGCFLFLLKVGWGRFLIFNTPRWSLHHWQGQRCSIVGLYNLSKDRKAESKASRRMGAAYNKTDCIKDLYRVMSIFVFHTQRHQ